MNLQSARESNTTITEVPNRKLGGDDFFVGGKGVDYYNYLVRWDAQQYIQMMMEDN